MIIIKQRKVGNVCCLINIQKSESDLNYFLYCVYDLRAKSFFLGLFFRVTFCFFAMRGRWGKKSFQALFF